MNDNNHVRIFDTTLRDGEQSPGATLDSNEKLEIARVLAKLGVDVMEAGFPAASPGDLAAVQTIASEVGTANGPIITGLSRAAQKDIDACWEAVSPAAKPRIHTFIATSDVHMKHKLRMERAEVIERAVKAVRYARSLCEDVEFSAEDAARSDVGFLKEIFAAVIEAGASTINIPDTVGYAVPTEYAALIREIVTGVPGMDKCIASVHCHDDLGMATANSLAGVEAGARQVECTINGIGERAGNASLEEIVMAIKTRTPYYNLHTNINATQLTRASHLVAARTGLSVQTNKAIVGRNAFAHEAGIHQDGVLKHAATYEIMTPESVGLTQSHLVLGKHSGRHALRKRLEELFNVQLEDDRLNRVFDRFKRLADKKKTVNEAELEALISDELYQPADVFVLLGVHVSCGAPSVPTASVSMTCPDGEHVTRASTGTGPVDAIFSAVNQVVDQPVELLEYAVHAVSGGIDTLGEVTVRVRGQKEKTRVCSGHGADTDILVASAKAYVAAINKLATVEGWMPLNGAKAAAVNEASNTQGEEAGVVS